MNYIDPLETRNAYFNLCKLGGYAKRYIPSFYGDMKDGLPSDRLVIEWDLRSSRVKSALTGKKSETDVRNPYPKLFDWELDEGVLRPHQEHPLEMKDGYLVPVPKAIADIKQTNLELARI